MNYQDINVKAITDWISEGWQWGKPISHEEYVRAQKGEWKILLTPTKIVPREWLGELKGKKLLGLASGGGQQMPVFSAYGADCTVLDYTPAQLDSERLVSEREGYNINIVRADMTKPLPFANNSFDIIFHPVSNCYVREVRPIFKECYRILKKGGILLCGLDNGVNFMVGDDEKTVVNRFPFDPIANKDQMEMLEKTNDGVQFSHTAEEQIGGQLEAGFTLTNIIDDTNGEGYLDKLGIPCFWATRAVK